MLQDLLISETYALKHVNEDLILVAICQYANKV